MTQREISGAFSLAVDVDRLAADMAARFGVDELAREVAVLAGRVDALATAVASLGQYAGDLARQVEALRTGQPTAGPPDPEAVPYHYVADPEGQVYGGHHG